MVILLVDGNIVSWFYYSTWIFFLWTDSDDILVTVGF
jgi:hypothetical protein